MSASPRKRTCANSPRYATQLGATWPGRRPHVLSEAPIERTRWRSRRLRQLGKSSQPIETKWADLAPVGKIAAQNQRAARDSYQAAERLTLWGFPNRSRHDSRWQTEGVCHEPRYSSAGGLYGRPGSPACPASERCCAGATVISDCGSARRRVPLPPRAPELNGQENIWQFMRQNW